MNYEFANKTERTESPESTAGVLRVVMTILRPARFGFVARVILTFMFWSSGLAKLIDFNGGLAEMSHFGLEPAWLFNTATIVVLLAASLLVIINRWAWLGAGALATFTVLTIPIAHSFWTMEEPIGTMEFHVVMEHITVVGGLLVAAYASAIRSNPKSSN